MYEKMAAVKDRHNTVSAITPEARPCSDDDGDDAAKEAIKAIAMSHSHSNNEKALIQYSQYRSAPTLFPSYDRLRFVRLPSDWLIRPLLVPLCPTANDPAAAEGAAMLQYWPALIYKNYAELTRDLGKNCNAMTKAKFTLNHRRNPNVIVARLIGWDDSILNTSDNDDDGDTSEGGMEFFPETELHLFQLEDDSSTAFSSTNILLDSSKSNSSRILSFYDNHYFLDQCCVMMLQRYSFRNFSGETDDVNHDRQKKREEAKEATMVYRYAVQFQRAVDMALNCLALDVGDDVIPPSRRIVIEEGNREEEGREGVLVTAGGATAPATLGVKMNDREAKVVKKKSNDTRADNVEAAIPPPATSKHAAVAMTKSSKLGPNQQTKEQQQKMVMSKKVNANSRCDKRGGGGGTKSRPDASQQNIPKKFQSASKKDPIMTTNTNLTKQQSSLPWNQVWKIMRRHGWTWAKPTGLTGYRYVKPGCKIKGGQENVDYFNSESDVQIFARNVYGWGVETCNYSVETIEKIIGDHAKHASEVVPPLQSTIEPNEPWKCVWDKMRNSGWTWRVGSGLMMDYYYIKPNCKVSGGVKGADYFERVEDVQKFAKRNYGWVGDEVEADKEGGGGGGGNERTALMDLNDNSKKRKRMEKDVVAKPVSKTVKTFKSKIDRVKSVKEEEVEEENENDIADDDNTSPFSDARSTFSQSGFQSKKLFTDECADEIVPSLEGEQIHPDDLWTDVWKTMKKTGWTWRGGSKLMTDYYYIKPGCNIRDGEEGKHYFVTESDVQRFAERNYGWRGKRSLATSSKKSKNYDDGYVDSAPAETMQAKRTKQAIARSKSSTNHPSTPQDRKTKPQDPAKPLLSSAESCFSQSSSSSDDYYDWNNLWSVLQTAGWTCVKASNPLHDWYYVRPNRDIKDSRNKLGRHYFTCPDDVIDFVKTLDEKDGKQSRKSDIGGMLIAFEEEATVYSGVR